MMEQESPSSDLSKVDCFWIEMPKRCCWNKNQRGLKSVQKQAHTDGDKKKNQVQNKVGQKVQQEH